MVSRRELLRAGFAAVVFVALLSVGLSYAVRSTDRGDEVGVVEWWVDLLGAWEAFVPDTFTSTLFSLLPVRVGFAELAGIAVLSLTLVVWTGAEARWAGWTVESALAQVRSVRGGGSADESPSVEAEDPSRRTDDRENE
ncbi:hypothetical protein [Halostella sp. PRR32]|uniref:hypothetical protein n=1 Tax=Halostella sp. PRR32 TaxID=3098147 RepID=UPI002B1E6294|nr:hypothetical protein [Halostella sp. PRR32]